MADARKRILLIDDEAGMLRLLKLGLESTGDYHVRTEASGSRGLAAVREFIPDLVVLDVVMPDTNGVEVALQIRAEPRFARMPIVFLTAAISEDDVREGRGFLTEFPVIAKPATVGQIIERIESELAS